MTDKNIRSDAGFTLIETILALTISAIIGVFAVQMIFDNLEEDRVNHTASHLKRFIEASDSFMRDNFADLRTAPQVRNAADLSDYLPDNFNRTGFGQSYELLTRPIVNGDGETIVEGLIVAGDGRLELQTKHRGLIAARAGARAGHFDFNFETGVNNGTVLGSYGGWSIPFVGWPATTIANPELAGLVFLDGTTATSDYLYRHAVPGMPELNRMQTTLDMDGNAIVNIGELDLTNNGATPNIFSDDGLDIQTDVDAGQDLRLNPFGNDVVIGQRVDDGDGDPSNDVADGTLRVGDLYAARIAGDPQIEALGGASLSDLLPRWRTIGSVLVQNGSQVGMPATVTPGPGIDMSRSCISGLETPKIYLVPRTAHTDFGGLSGFFIRYRAEVDGNLWNIHLEQATQGGLSGNANLQALAQVYCARS